MAEEWPHAVCVDAWLARFPPGLASEQLVGLHGRALNALWQRTLVTLGEVTLTAIMQRVRDVAVERFPVLEPSRVDASGLRLDGITEGGPFDAAALSPALRFVLTEFLRVIGSLTGEILSPALHAVLAQTSVTSSAEAATSPLPSTAPRAIRTVANR